MRSARRVSLAAGMTLLLVLVTSVPGEAGRGRGSGAAKKLKKVERIVVIYQENHSFNNLLGEWEGVEGIADAPPERTIQVDQNGMPLGCLIQNDPTLSKVEPAACSGEDAGGAPFQSHFLNQPFEIGQFVAPDADTCTGNIGRRETGCTLDLNHNYYQSLYEMNEGAMNRFVAGNDESAGLAMGYWDTQELPIYRYLHKQDHPDYVVADRFFQAAIGGSMLNHQWLVAARTPTWPDAPNVGIVGDRQGDLHSVIDVNGMPVSYQPSVTKKPSLMYRSPLENATSILFDGPLTASCNPVDAGDLSRPAPPPGIPCGDFAINTIRPGQQPTAGDPSARLPLQPRSAETIGDLLSDEGVGWAWYSAGWSNANGEVGAPGWTNGDGPNCGDARTLPNSDYPFCPSVAFTFHHQPFNFFESFSRQTKSGRKMRRHLRDLEELMSVVDDSRKDCEMKRVSFVKLMRDENEHPGSPPSPGNMTAVGVLRQIENSACADDTMVIFTYDEYGGAWDHVPPPGQGATPGPHDRWGPGPRIPAIIVSPLLPHRFAVDHTPYDTTSILATIEERFGLPSLGRRDAEVNDLSDVFEARPVTE